MSAMTEPWEVNFVREMSFHRASGKATHCTYRKISVSVELNTLQSNRSISDGEDGCACGI
jgi:hypothetical protein